MFISATNFVGLSVCSFLVTVGFSTSKQQFVLRQVPLAQLAHGGGGNDRTLIMVGPQFEEDRILEEESSHPQRAGRGVLYFMGGGRRKLRVGRTKGTKSGRKPKRRKRGNGWHAANFRSSLALHAVEKFRMKDECEGERGECKGEREGEWF
jgi:hypothetical protein